MTSGGTMASRVDRIRSLPNRCLALETSFHVFRSWVWNVSGSMMSAEPFATRLMASRTDVTWIGVQARLRTRAGRSRTALMGKPSFLIDPIDSVGTQSALPDLGVPVDPTPFVQDQRLVIRMTDRAPGIDPAF